eukprot:3040457-Pyramimonas_sp.AAC.1
MRPGRPGRRQCRQTGEMVEETRLCRLGVGRHRAESATAARPQSPEHLQLRKLHLRRLIW